MVKRLTLSDKNHEFAEKIDSAVEVLNTGGLIIYPTETCYGVGCDAMNAAAVTKMLDYKRRPEGKAISIAVNSPEMAEVYVEVNETGRNVYRNFLPGPVTVISQSRHKVDSRLESENGTLGIRMPDYDFTLQLIEKFGRPITATSANSAGKKTPYCFEDVKENISTKQQSLLDLFIDAGELPHNPPSTVVDTTLNEEKVLRKGKIEFQSNNFQTFISTSVEQTQSLAGQLLSETKKKFPDVCIIFSLQGELGAGKTQFTKGVARALGIEREIISPTFNIVNEYDFGNHKFYHLDTWRLMAGENFSKYLPESSLQNGNVIVIEWSEKVSDYLAELNQQPLKLKVIPVVIDYLDLNRREIRYLKI